jgi:hypothetical protein
MPRVCSKCGPTENEFPKTGAVCKPCVKKYKHAHYLAHKEEINAKNLQHHHANRQRAKERARARYVANRADAIAAAKRYALEHPDKVLGYNLKRYGLIVGQYRQMEAAQGGVCKICHLPPPAGKRVKRLVVDHDHKTGRVRALLCVNCNTLVGVARESVDILERAISYLKAGV